jgi:hypothetical protein
MIPGICVDNVTGQRTAAAIVFRDAGAVLDRGRRLTVEAEPTANTHLCRHHFRLDVTPRKLALCQNIRSGLLMQHRRMPQHGERRIDDGCQWLIGDLDPIQRVFSQVPAFGKNGHDRLTDIAHPTAR